MLKTEFCKMTIRHHIEQRELRERQEKAKQYSEEVEDRCYYRTTADLLLAMALLLFTLSIAFGG